MKIVFLKKSEGITIRFFYCFINLHRLKLSRNIYGFSYLFITCFTNFTVLSRQGILNSCGKLCELIKNDIISETF